MMVPGDPCRHRLPSAKMQRMAAWETDSQMGPLTAYVDAMKQALGNISSNNALGYFKGCGYFIESE